MKSRIEPTDLLEALNSGPGEPHEDVRAAGEVFEVNERTVYRYITRHGIRREYRWVIPDTEAA